MLSQSMNRASGPLTPAKMGTTAEGQEGHEDADEQGADHGVLARVGRVLDAVAAGLVVVALAQQLLQLAEDLGGDGIGRQQGVDLAALAGEEGERRLIGGEDFVGFGADQGLELGGECAAHPPGYGSGGDISLLAARPTAAFPDARLAQGEALGGEARRGGGGEDAAGRRRSAKSAAEAGEQAAGGGDAGIGRERIARALQHLRALEAGDQRDPWCRGRG